MIHRDLPRSIEGYYQEIGRPGRDGLPNDCVLLYSWSEVVAYDRLAQEAPSEIATRIKSQVRQMYRFASGSACRHQRLAAHFGEKMAACGDCCDCCTQADPGAPARRAGSNKWLAARAARGRGR